MGIGLRGSSRVSSGGGSEQDFSQRKVSDKRNNLKNMVAGEIGPSSFKKQNSLLSS
jgi:hypothetical protein